MFDYILCVLLFFPSLCLYDKWLQNPPQNRFLLSLIEFQCCRRRQEGQDRDQLDGDSEGEDEGKPSLIRRILLKLYKGIHFARWGIVLISLVGAIVCGFYASQLALPNTADVRLLTNDNEYERAAEWRLNLLSDVLVKKGTPGYSQKQQVAERLGNILTLFLRTCSG